MNDRIASFLRLCLLVVLLAGAALQPQFPVGAATAITVEPLTWNIVGLDSNSPAVGPYRFPVGIRACNPGTNTVTMADVEADFVWMAGGTTNDDTVISLRSGSLDPIAPNPQINLAPGICTDFYFEVEVNRSAPSPYDQTRRYRIDVSYDDPEIAGIQTVSSSTPRELFVEHLISQSRNAITNVRLNGAAIPAGGTMSLMVGNTYTITLEGGTATQGYNQFEAFINFPNTIFQILSVSTTYSADDSPYVSNPNNKLYADACKWENDPNSPNYRSCIGGDYKAGGSNVVTTYTIKIIGGGGTRQTLNTLLYDFSGSSYHYNADYSIGIRFADIIDPANVNITKSFSPNPTNVNGISALTITLTNPNSGAISGYNFIDPLPANMTVANPPNAATTSCGTPTFAPVAGANSISFSNGTIAANGSCTIKVNVTPSATGSFLNTTDHLFVDSLDTGKFATSTLTVNTTPPLPPPPPSCASPVELAIWTMAPAQGTTVPPVYFNKAADVAAFPTTAASYVTVSGANSISTAQGTPINSWGGTAPTGADGWSETPSSMNNYFQFVLDTSNYGGVYVTFDAGLFPNGDWANPTSNIYVNTSANGGPFTVFAPYPQANKGGWATGLTATAATTGTNTTTFRFGVDGASKSTATFYLDNVRFMGCPRPVPATITKAFSPNPIAVNGVSTLTFTLSNPNTTALTGATFTDTLPSGLQVAATPSATTTCGGTPTWAPATGATALTFGSPTGGTIPASGSCTVSVNVTGAAAGAYQNVSGFLSSTNGGTNTGSTGSASASLTVISPPGISKLFSPNPVLAGGTSTLTFNITNPNQSNALTGVAFTDTFPTTPGQMRVAATPSASATNCGTPTFAPAANAVSISFSNGTIAAGATCTVKVDVTVPSTPISGSYANTSGVVSSTNGGTGNTASDTLAVNAPDPSIALYKQVGPTATGPWSKFLGVTLPGSVYYLFTVENTGDVPLSPVSVTDPAVSTAGCTWPATLPVAVAANNNHIATCVVGPVTASSGSVTNTATASGTYDGTPYTSTSSSARYASQSLTITKNVTESYFTATGDILHYSFIVGNTGFAPLLGPVTVTDDHIVGVVGCAAASNAALIVGGGPGDGDDYLDPGEQVVCPAAGTVTYTTTASDVTNQAVTNNAYGSASGVDSPAVSKTVPLAQLTIDKDTTTTSIDTNGVVVYTIAVVNTGQIALTNFQVSDVLPDFGGTSAVLSVTAPGYTANGSYTGGAPNTDLLAGTDTLAVGATATIIITVDLVNATPGTYDNSATVSTTQTGSIDDDGLIGGDPGTPGIGADPETDEDVTLNMLVAPTVTKVFGTGDLAAGGNTNLTVTISNPNASAIMLTSALTDTFPTGMTINTAGNSGTCPGVTATAGAVNFTIASGTSIPAGGCTVIVNVTSNTAGAATNAIPAGALQTSAGINADPATSTLNVYVSPTVTKTFGSASISAGGNTTLTLTLTNPNTNPGTLTTVQVDDTFPTGLTLQNTTFNFTPVACGSVTNTGGGASAAGDGNVRFSTASLAVGADCQVVINVTSSTAGAITNTTNAPTASGPVALTGTTASANLSVIATVDLTVSKSNNVNGLIAQNGTFNWTITVTNGGAGTASFANTNVIMSDTLPGVAGYYPQGALTVTVGATPPTGTINCSIAGTALSCVANGVVTLPAGASFSVTFAVTPTAAGSLANTTMVDPGGVIAESNEANNSGSNTVGIVNAVKTIVSTSESSTGYLDPFERVMIGEIIRYRLTTYLPEGTWTNVQITDTIDTGMQFLNNGSVTLSYVCDSACTNSPLTITPGTFTSSTDPTFNLGTVSNPDTDVNAEYLIVEFNTLVLNWPTNIAGGATRDNSYSISFNGTAITSPAVGVRISEPSITNLVKAVSPAAGPYYPGDTITYTLTYSNGSTGVTRATAFDVFVTDALSANLDLQNVSVAAPTGSTVTDTSTTGTGGVVRILVDQVPPAVDIASGPTGVTITVVAQIATSAPAGTLSNTANLTFTGLPGGVTTGDTNGTCPNVTGSCTPGTSGATTGERNGTGGAPNIYADTASIDITVALPTANLVVSKDNGVTNVLAGGTTTYTLTLTNTGPSAADNSTISDSVVVGLTKTAIGACTSAGGAVCPTAGAGAGQLNIANLETGTAVVPALPVGGSISFTVTATVTATSGSVANTFAAAPPAGITDPTPASATDTDTVIEILAVNDTGSTVAGMVGGQSLANVLVNDTLNGNPATLANITLTQVSTTHPGVTLDPSDGSVNVAPGTPAGTYTVTYQICDQANPTFCDTAIVSVPVSAAAIDAVDDDYSSTPLNGYTGGNAGNAFANDTLNGVAVVPAQITAAIVTPASNPGVTLNTTTGSVDVAAGTPAGTYTINYQICESLNPTNCDTAAITVVVAPPLIDAVNDNFSGMPVNGSIGGTTATVYTNDTLNGVPFAPADVTSNITDDGGIGVTINANGTLNVPAGTPAGTYTVIYRICEVLNPTNCDTATATIVVNPPVINAVDDNYSASPLNGYTGGSAGNAFTNDTLNGVAVIPAQVTATVVTPATNVGVTLNISTGSVDVAAGTPAGTYTIVYEICENLNPANCDTATITVVVTPPVIDAVNDDYSGTPINGFTGGNAGNAFTNDTLNGLAIVPAQITATVVTPASNPGVTLNTVTGSVDVAAGTPAGTYTIDYRICENLNPTNCDTARITVVISLSAVNVAKSSTATSITAAGQVVPYTFTVTNAGNVVLTGITLVDPNCDVAPAYQSGDTNTNTSLELTETWIYTCSHTVTQAEMNAGGNLNNTVTVDSTESGPDTDTLDIPVVQTRTHTTVKSQTSTGTYVAGSTITYDIVVRNTGNVPLTGVTVSDNSALLGTCTPAQPSTLAPNATMTCSASHVVTQVDMDNGSYANTATGDSDQTPPNTSTVTVNFTQTPALNVVKEVSTDNVTWNDTSVNVTIGDLVYYRVRVANTGNLTLTELTVDDGMLGCTLIRAADITGDNDTVFEVGEEWAYTCSVTAVTGTNDNTATADSNETGQDSDTASYTASAALVVDPAISKAGNPTQASIGETVVFTLTVTNQGNAPAPNVVVTDPMPAMFDVVSVTSVYQGGGNAGTISVSPGPAPYTVTVNLGTLNVTDVVTITITTTVNGLGTPPINNTATLATTALNDPIANNSARVAITIRTPRSSLPATGFAPNVVTDLSAQPQDLRYTVTDVVLEIPSLGIKIPIVGVPKKNGEWDVTWLGKQAGWLDGTAFPSWNGNSVLTGHVYLSNGLPGPFVGLNKLRYGDKLIVHAYGQKYIFEVRTNQVVEPGDTSAYKHEEKSWLTLVTCKDYDEKTKTYKNRVVVRAVLVRVE